MAQPLSKEVLDSAVDPAVISEQSFDVTRRGFNQRQVQQYLAAVAEALRDAQNREADMRRRIGKAVRRAETAEQKLRDLKPTERDDTARQIGDEVAAVLEAARLAGEQSVASATEEAEQIRVAAKTEATEMRSAAVKLASDRQAEAETIKQALVSEAEVEAQSLRQQARTDAEAMLVQAAARVEQARSEGDNLIQEASEARAQILEDMERRRRQARVQVERLRVGRDRLLRSYELVRRTLDETTDELKISLKEAKLRGDSAARSVASQPMATRDELEEELRGAQIIGRSPALPRPLQEATLDEEVDSQPRAKRGAPQPRKPVVTETNQSKIPAQPKAPAFAPVLTPRPESDGATQGLATTAARADTAAPVSAAGAAEGQAVPDEVETGQSDDVIDITDEAVAAELEALTDDDLNILVPSDAIEEVLALPADTRPEEAPGRLPAGTKPVETSAAQSGDPGVAESGLFAALRAQRSETDESAAKNRGKAAAAGKEAGKAGGKDAADESAAKNRGKAAAAGKEAGKAGGKDAADEAAAKNRGKKAAAAGKDAGKKVDLVDSGDDRVDTSDDGTTASRTRVDAGPVDESDAAFPAFPGIAAQRDAVIADAAKQLEKRLKRALADEQNELLAGLRKGKRKQVVLAGLVGDADAQLSRYVSAINEVAAVTYGAGAALIDAEAEQGRLPAGAVEELLVADVVSPIRTELESLDRLDVASADMHVDPVRSFYRQRKTDHLGAAATRLAHLLCVAGVCDALPAKAPLPWATTTI